MGVVSGEFVGRFRVVVVIDRDDQNHTPTPSGRITGGDGRAMIELTGTLTDRQLAEIAEQAAALVSTGAQARRG
jgi:hypothetical protein